MTIQQAQNIIGYNRDVWELRNTKKALSFMGALNTPEENKRLAAVKTLLYLENELKCKR